MAIPSHRRAPNRTPRARATPSLRIGSAGARLGCAAVALLIEGIVNRGYPLPLAQLTNRVDDFATHDLFTELTWRPADGWRLIGGARLSRLPDAYRLRSEDLIAGTTLEEAYPVPDRNLVTGRVAALWNLDEHQVLKLIWGTAAQDNDRIQFPEPEQIETAELVYVQARPSWMLSASLFRNRITNIVRSIQRFDGTTQSFFSSNDNSGELVTNSIELIGS
jgi:outer membrane receptor protein involved in Fe transport